MLSRKYILAIILLVPLLSSSFVSSLPAGSALPSGAFSYSFVLPSRSLEHFTVDGYANDNTVTYSLSSNTNVTVALMTSPQFQTFRVTRSMIASSLYYKNGTVSQGTIDFAPGSDVLLVFAPGGKANVTFSYQVYPDNPFVGGLAVAPESLGIASYGLTNQSGTDSPYAVRSTDVVGVAGISAMQAFNATAERLAQVPASSASLQLNSVLVVNEAGDASQVYWCQNTPTFVTATSQLELADNVWNYSASGFLSNSTVTSQGGAGAVYSFPQSGGTGYFYDYEGANSTYSLPLGLVNLINATEEPGVGVLVQFGEQVVDAAAPAGQLRYWFDNVTIHDPTVQSAYFLTSGNDTTPGGLFYDTEFAFAGDANGEAANFTAMDSALGLFYTNGTASHSLTAFPSYFSFGYDTAEAADDLKVTYLGNGAAQLSVGPPAYDYLGQASGNFSVSSVESALGISTSGSMSTTSSSTATSGSLSSSLSSSSSTSSTSTTVTSGPSTTTSSVASTPLTSSTSSSPSSSSSSIDPRYVIGAAGVSAFIAIAAMATWLTVKKREASIDQATT